MGAVMEKEFGMQNDDPLKKVKEAPENFMRHMDTSYDNFFY